MEEARSSSTISVLFSLPSYLLITDLKEQKLNLLIITFQFKHSMQFYNNNRSHSFRTEMNEQSIIHHSNDYQRSSNTQIYHVQYVGLPVCIKETIILVLKKLIGNSDILLCINDEKKPLGHENTVGNIYLANI